MRFIVAASTTPTNGLDRLACFRRHGAHEHNVKHTQLIGEATMITLSWRACVINPDCILRTRPSSSFVYYRNRGISVHSRGFSPDSGAFFHQNFELTNGEVQSFLSILTVILLTTRQRAYGNIFTLDNIRKVSVTNMVSKTTRVQ